MLKPPSIAFNKDITIGNTKVTDRIVYLDLLRIISIFAMMLLHIAASQWGNISVYTLAWQTFNIYDSLVRFCVPIFIMISGVFFLDPYKRLNIRTLFTQKILRLIVAFVFWSFCYALLFTLSSPNGIKISNFFLLFSIGQHHLWFLSMLISLYLITPLLRSITSNKKLTQYFLLLSFIFCFSRNFIIKFPIEYLHILTSKMIYMDFIMGYSGYFVLGFYIYKYKISKRTRIALYILGILSLVFTIVATSHISLSSGKPSGIFYDNLLPNTYFTSIMLFVFFKYNVSQINFSNLSLKYISILSSLSFGMYLVHDLFNIILLKHNVTTLTFNPIFSTLSLTIVVFISSFCIIYIISKIPILNKWII